MLGISWFFVNGILLIAATTMASEPQDTANTVKSTLKRALGSNNTENADDINFLNKVQRVISKMKNVFVNKRNARRSMNDNTKLEKFTDFIQDVIKKLNKYDENDLENFFTVFSNEVTSYHYKGCKFHELTDNFAFRIFLSGLFKDIKVQPGATIKTKLEALANKMRKKQYDRNEKELLDVINSMYRQDSIENFQNVLINIDAYRMKSRKNLDLVQIVRDGLRSVLFDHYTKLHHNARRALKLQLNEYWNNLSVKLPSKAKDFVRTPEVSKNEFTKPTDSRVNKRIIVKESDRYIELGIKYNRAIHSRNDKNNVNLKSLYLSSVITTPRLIKTDINKIKKDLNTENIVRNAEKIMHKINHKIIKIHQATHIPSRTTKHSKTVKYHTKNNMNLKYETDAYEFLTTEARKKKLTFMTLYPEFASAWTSSKRLGGRRKLSYRKSADNIKYMWQEADISDVTPKSKVHKVRRNGAATKELQAQLNNPIRFSAAEESSAEKVMRLKKKLKLSKSAKTSARHRRYFSADSSYRNQQSFSLESGSSDNSSKVEQKVLYRRNEITNTTNSSLTISNDSFKHPEIIKEHIGSEIKNKTIKTFNDEAGVKEVKNKLSSENNKTDGNITVSNTNNKRNSTEADSMKDRVRVKYANDIHRNKSISNVINKTVQSSEESHSETEEFHDFNTNRETNDLKSKPYLQDNKIYSDRESAGKYFYNKSCTSIYDNENNFKPNRSNIANTVPFEKNHFPYKIQRHLHSNQMKSEQSMESSGELDAWEPKAKHVAKNTINDYENYYAMRKHSARKRNEDKTSFDFKNEKINNTENVTMNTSTNTTSANNIHTVAVVSSKPTPKTDPAFYYADVIENIDHITKEETLAPNFNVVTLSMAKKEANKDKSGEIKDISEEKDNEGRIGQDMYKDTNERIKYINENDELADEFPELVPVFGKIGGRA